MPNLTPIAVSEEEHQRLTSLKHKLEASSWRDMLMKLCDIYEEYIQLKATHPDLSPEEGNPIPDHLKNYIHQQIEEKLPQKPDNPKKQDEPATKLFNKLGKTAEKEGNPVHEEELIRIVKKCVREELSNHKFEVEIPTQQQQNKPTEELDSCPECGTKSKKTAKYCPECGVEFQD